MYDMYNNNKIFFSKVQIMIDDIIKIRNIFIQNYINDNE